MIAYSWILFYHRPPYTARQQRTGGPVMASDQAENGHR